MAVLAGQRVLVRVFRVELRDELLKATVVECVTVFINPFRALEPLLAPPGGVQTDLEAVDDLLHFFVR